MTYRHKLVWPGKDNLLELNPNWRESADWRRERSSRVWQAMQCWLFILGLGKADDDPYDYDW